MYLAPTCGQNDRQTHEVILMVAKAERSRTNTVKERSEFFTRKSPSGRLILPASEPPGRMAVVT